MSGVRKDISGNRYGKLVVVGFSHMDRKHSYYFCKCDCGNEITARSDCLKTGTIKSCGCLVKDNHVKTHGQSRSKLYRVYYGMKQRCYNPNHKAYYRYGGRGISICEEWKNDFKAFYDWAIENGYQDGLTIDRKDYNGNYEPNNCRWVTQAEQSRNTSRNTLITIDGVTRLLVEWCEIYGVNMSTACYRIKKNLPIKKVFNINE